MARRSTPNYVKRRMREAAERAALREPSEIPRPPAQPATPAEVEEKVAQDPRSAPDARRGDPDRPRRQGSDPPTDWPGADSFGERF
jgi:hypothetical protein